MDVGSGVGVLVGRMTVPWVAVGVWLAAGAGVGAGVAVASATGVGEPGSPAGSSVYSGVGPGVESRGTSVASSSVGSRVDPKAPPVITNKGGRVGLPAWNGREVERTNGVEVEAEGVRGGGKIKPESPGDAPPGRTTVRPGGLLPPQATARVSKTRTVAGHSSLGLPLNRIAMAHAVCTNAVFK